MYPSLAFSTSLERLEDYANEHDEDGVRVIESRALCKFICMERWVTTLHCFTPISSTHLMDCFAKIAFTVGIICAT